MKIIYTNDRNQPKDVIVQHHMAVLPPISSPQNKNELVSAFGTHTITDFNGEEGAIETNKGGVSAVDRESALNIRENAGSPSFEELLDIKHNYPVGLIVKEYPKRDNSSRKKKKVAR